MRSNVLHERCRNQSRSHDATEKTCDVLERSAEQSIAVARARSKQSALGSARGQRLGWRHSIASKHVWSDCAERTTVAQTQLNRTKNVVGLSSAESEYYALTKKRMLRTGSAKLVLPTGT